MSRLAEKRRRWFQPDGDGFVQKPLADVGSTEFPQLWLRESFRSVVVPHTQVGSVFRSAPALHFLLRVNAVAVPIKRNTVVHAAVPDGGSFEKFTSPLVDHTGSRPTSGHESGDAAVQTAASFRQFLGTIDVCTPAATFTDAHECKLSSTDAEENFHRRSDNKQLENRVGGLKPCRYPARTELVPTFSERAPPHPDLIL